MSTWSTEHAAQHALTELKIAASADTETIGTKIAMIKTVRAHTGWGLKEAKDYVEDLITAIIKSHGPVSFPEPEPEAAEWLVTYFDADVDGHQVQRFDTEGGALVGARFMLNNDISDRVSSVRISKVVRKAKVII